MDAADPVSAGTGRRPGVAALIAAIVGAGLMVWGFLAGIDAALNGATGTNLVFTAVFLVGAALVVGALLVALYWLIRGGPRMINSIAVAVALLPLIAVLVLVLRNAAAS